MRTKKAQNVRILVLDDEPDILRLLVETLESEGYIVEGVNSVASANAAIAEALSKGSMFNVAIVDLYLRNDHGTDFGGDFGRRLIDIIGNINVVICTAHVDWAKRLSYQPDGVITKPFNITTVLETVQDLAKPVRRTLIPPELKLRRWALTAPLRGIDALRPFSYKLAEDRIVEKITSVAASDGEWITGVLYSQQTDDGTDENVLNIGVSSLIGCRSMCKFCMNWRYRRNSAGLPMPFVRQLTSSEIISQVYLALNSSRIKNAICGSSKKIVVNFTCEGDGFVYNLANCAQAILILSRVTNPEISFIITSIGSEESLREYIAHYTGLPRVTHYWSVNSLFPKQRAWLMPGTAKESLECMRDSYETIAELTGRPVTVSWIVIKGITDQPEDAEMIREFFGGRPFRIKLMALVKDSLREEKIGDVPIGNTTEEDVENFRCKLQESGLPVRVRKILGSEICSGCGNTVPEWMAGKLYSNIRKKRKHIVRKR